MASGDLNSAENVPGRSSAAGAGGRHRFIQRDLDGFRRETIRSGQGAQTGTRRAFPAAWGGLPLEEKRRLNSADDWSDRLRATWPAVWRAYLEDFVTPSVSLTFHGGDMATVRLLMRAFGMSFVDLPPPAFPDPAEYGIPADVYWIAKRAGPAGQCAPTAEERRSLAEFGAALTTVASWHAAADVPGIPEHKLTIDASMETRYWGWTINAVECAAALRIWRSLVKRYGEATLLRRVGAELETELWSGWLAHLDNAFRLDGLYVVGSLEAWGVLHRLRADAA